MEYTIYLRTEEDFNIIKKLLKAFDGASIRPVEKPSEIERALEESKDGNIVGPFNNVEELMADLLN